MNKMTKKRLELINQYCTDGYTIMQAAELAKKKLVEMGYSQKDLNIKQNEEKDWAYLRSQKDKK